MSRGSRLFAGIVVAYIAAVVLLLYRISLDIDPRYRESAEESLVDTANLLATLLERQAYAGVIQTQELERTLEHLAKRPLDARIFQIEKKSVVLHVYVTDALGTVLYDSAAGATSAKTIGAGATSSSRWRDSTARAPRSPIPTTPLRP